MEEEASKVRLVRCPKCSNLLPELPNFSVYQCGGCGAVLRAKNKGTSEEGLSELSDDEKGRGVYDKQGGVTMNSRNASEMKRENNGIELGISEERGQSGRLVSGGGGSTSRAEKREVSVGMEKIDQRRRVDFRDDGEYVRNSKVPVDDSVGGNGGDIMNEPEEARRPVRPLRSRTRSVVEDWGMESAEEVVSRGSNRGFPQPGRFSKFSYLDEGPSNYDRASYDRYGGQMRYRQSMDGMVRVADLENDRAELLKKLDELKDKISNSSDLAENPKERLATGRRPLAPPDPYTRHDAYMHEGFSYGVNNHPFPPDKHISSHPYYPHSFGYSPVEPVDLALHDSYPRRNYMNDHPGYKDTYYPQMSRRTPHEPLHQYPQQTYQEHLPDYYVNYDPDPFRSRMPATFFHQPTCSCSDCLNKNWQGPAQIQPPGYKNLSSRHGPFNRVPYHHLNTVSVGEKTGYGSDVTQSRFVSHDRFSLMRTPSDLDSDNGGFTRYQPREVTKAKGDASVCHPISGGAPFITCCQCNELLKIPKKLWLPGKGQRKVRCGACSSTLLFESVRGGIIITALEQTNLASEEVSDFPESAKDKLQNYRDWSNTEADNSSKVQSTNSEPNLYDDEQRSNSSGLEKRHYSRSSSSSFSGDEQSPENMIVRDAVSHSTLAVKDASSPVPSSPHQGHPDKYPSNDTMDRYNKGYNIEHTDEERDVVEKIKTRQNSLKDVPTATEMDISANEFSNSGVSLDSVEVSKEGGSRFNRFAGLIRRSLKDFSRSTHGGDNGKSKVVINGHLITDHVLKKVEKVSGPIRPGEYWYDYRAGFWGVIGHPCLGIIPPKIGEFNYPMPENCSNGNTKVYVNGRELHQKDLDLLCSRGLPPTRHKSYIIGISGKVKDEHTGEELDSLGKLAPTVERARHGFGMKIPKSISQ